MFIRLFLIVILLPLQSCSNTLIGEKLENSFDTNENEIISEKINNKPQKSNEIPKIKSRIKVERKENGKDFENTIQEKTIANKDRLSQKSSKLVKKTISFIFDTIQIKRCLKESDNVMDFKLNLINILKCSPMFSMKHLIH